MQATRVRDAAAIRGLFLLFGFCVAAFFPFLSLYLEGRHGLTESQIGLVIASMALARVIGNPFWGHFSDTRLGRLTALQIGTAGTAMAAIGMNLADSLAILIVAAVLQALFMVALGPNVDAIALVHLGDERMSEYGKIRSWESLTYAAGCVGFGAVLEFFGVDWAMPLYALSSLVVLAWSVTVVRDRPSRDIVHGRMGAVGAVFREAPRFWGFLAASLLVWTGFNGAWNYIGLRIVDQGGGPLLIGVGAALGGLIEVATMRKSSTFQRRFGLRKVYAVGCAVYALGFLLWGSISDPTWLSILSILEGVAFSLLFTSGVVIVGKLLPSTLYSTGNAVGQMEGFGLAPILGAGAGGLEYQHMGPATLYLYASVMAMAGAVVAWVVLDMPALDRPGDEQIGEPQIVPHAEAGPLP